MLTCRTRSKWWGNTTTRPHLTSLLSKSRLYPNRLSSSPLVALMTLTGSYTKEEASWALKTSDASSTQLLSIILTESCSTCARVLLRPGHREQSTAALSDCSAVAALSLFVRLVWEEIMSDRKVWSSLPGNESLRIFCDRRRPHKGSSSVDGSCKVYPNGAALNILYGLPLRSKLSTPKPTPSPCLQVESILAVVESNEFGRDNRSTQWL